MSKLKIEILADKISDETLIQEKINDEESDDMMWGGVAYRSMRFLDGDMPDPRKGLN